MLLTDQQLWRDIKGDNWSICWLLHYIHEVYDTKRAQVNHYVPLMNYKLWVQVPIAKALTNLLLDKSNLHKTLNVVIVIHPPNSYRWLHDIFLRISKTKYYSALWSLESWYANSWKHLFCYEFITFTRTSLKKLENL